MELPYVSRSRRLKSPSTPDIPVLSVERTPSRERLLEFGNARAVTRSSLVVPGPWALLLPLPSEGEFGVGQEGGREDGTGIEGDWNGLVWSSYGMEWDFQSGLRVGSSCWERGAIPLGGRSRRERRTSSNSDQRELMRDRSSNSFSQRVRSFWDSILFCWAEESRQPRGFALRGRGRWRQVRPKCTSRIVQTKHLRRVEWCLSSSLEEDWIGSNFSWEILSVEWYLDDLRMWVPFISDPLPPIGSSHDEVIF